MIRAKINTVPSVWQYAPYNVSYLEACKHFTHAARRLQLHDRKKKKYLLTSKYFGRETKDLNKHDNVEGRYYSSID